MTRTIALSAAAAAGLLAPGAVSAPAVPELYVLAGQSNMVGMGRLDALTAADRVADPAITLFGNDGRWRVASEPLDDPAGQTDAVARDEHPGVGPGLFFARRMRALGHPRIALLPCAKGGSAIDEWAPATARDRLYGACVARIGMAGQRPAGMLWYQGEADSWSAERAQAWAGKFTALAARLRADLRQPTLPIVVVALSDKPRGATKRVGWKTIQRAQMALSLPCVATVPAAGLPHNPDDLHVATAGQRTLGIRLAAAMNTLRRRGCG